MEQLGIAIIGCGNIYGVHAEAIAEYSGVKLVSVVDIDEDKADKAANKYNCSPYYNYHQVLADEKVDIVHICTPHFLHAPLAIDALEAGKQVLLEKPIAINVEDAENMIRAARANKRHLGIVFQNRFNNTSIKTKEILASGQLGKIKGIRAHVIWHRSPAYYQQADWRGRFETEGGGVLINQAIHTLDLLQWFAGEVEAIQAHVDTRLLNDVIEVEDTAEATLYFKDNFTGIFYATNCYSSNSPVEIEVDCEQGTLKISNGELTLSQNEKEEIITTDYSLTDFKSYWGTGHKKLIYNFYDSIKENTNYNYVAGEEGIKTLKIIKGIYRSSDSNQKISFN